MAPPRHGPDDEPRAPESAGAEESGASPSRSPGSRRSTRGSGTGTSSTSSTRAEDPFDIESPGGFTAPPDGRPRLEHDFDEELDEPAHLFDWTPERAGAIIRAGGYVLHAADRLGHVPGGEELWKATERDALAAGEPLARILNRYDAARRLVGLVDEAEFAAAMFDYARRNLEMRGRLVRQLRAQAADEPRYGAAAFNTMGGEPVDQVVYTQPVHGFAAETEAGEEDPTQPAPFDPMAPPPGF